MPLSNKELDEIVSRLGLTLGTEIDDPLPIRVETWAQIQEFVQEELAFHIRLRVQDMPRRVQNTARLLAEALEWQDPNRIGDAARNAIDSIQPRPNFISSRSRKGQFLATLGDAELDGARLALADEGSPSFRRDSFVGAFRVLAFEHGVLPNAQENAVAAKFELRFAEEVASARRRLDAHNAEFEKAHSEVDEQNKGLQRALLKFNADAASKLQFYDGLNTEATSASKAGIADLAALKATYEGHLKLAGPARYWREAERDYDAKAKRWLWVASGFVLAALSLAGIVLYHPPAGWDAQKITEGGGLRTVALLAVVTSLLVFSTAQVFKVVMSNFHLARDAGERHRLVYVYLALIRKEVVSTDKEREIVMNALFSRSDTGLLKQDGTPAMPGALGYLTPGKS